ncbi:diguanylate cyclase [Rhizobium sp. G21]|uniref:diguanylate cyclase n=1 Tax=Rhizobium sp. G21 TaxID=2758439 RepID=UPI001FEEEFBD|nr:diguanylate cyclase [Rhizobium sp. G21]
MRKRRCSRAERLRGTIEALAIPHHGLVEGGVVTASFGVSAAPRGMADLEDLVRAADAALYDAKRGGRNAVSFVTVAPSAAEYELLAG